MKEDMMKKIQLIALVLFFGILLLPMLNINRAPNQVSQIDNRELENFPTWSQWRADIEHKEVYQQFENALNDRIGFRSEMIDLCTEADDKLFHVMTHPIYEYGKDGYIFLKTEPESDTEEFIRTFCSFLRKAQDYCEEKNVPFIYCINPSKTEVYREYLPEGYHFQDSFLQYLYQELERNHINYISNVELLEDKAKEEQVFNVKYDAGHWNDLGAFYGTNHILNKVSEYFSDVIENELTDFEITTELETNLPVSKFSINEEIPVFRNKREETVHSELNLYSEIQMDENYPDKEYLVNETGDSLPRVLMFQGSYLNGRERFLESDFKELYTIHNYENFLHLEYYFNIFQPECVILETAEHVTNASYFDMHYMNSKNFYMSENFEGCNYIDLEDAGYTTKSEGNLITISVIPQISWQGGHLLLGDKTFDLNYNDVTDTFDCTIDQKYYQSGGKCMFFDKSMIVYE